MDLRPFITYLEHLNELRQVDEADPDLEIGAITELSDERNGPALLFVHIKGYPPGYRIVTNLIATPRRLAAALGFPAAILNVELVRLIKDKFKELKSVPPVYVTKGPITENVYREGEVDLFKLPVPKWHEYDGGRYLGTGDMVIMKDPEAGWVNVGTYRVQLHDRNTVGLYVSPGKQGRIISQKYWSKGKSCPVAVAFGAHPLVWLPSFLFSPWGVEEYGVAGALLGEPLQVIRGEYTGLPIPAHAEIVIEGDCPPPEVESRKEGPFGEWTGYYASGTRNEPIIKVKRIMHRNDPIIMGAPPLKPPGSGVATYVLRASNIWSQLEQLGIPGIKGVWQMRAGGSHYLNVIAIEQKYAGHAKQVGMAATSVPAGAFQSRFVIVVDEDIDPTNDEDVLWALATRCDPATTIEIVAGCWSSALDPTISPERKAKGDTTNSRAIMLACRPYHWKKDFPKVNRASDELRNRVMNKWGYLWPAANSG
ncbi:MAG: UbiD family decarboxylase [Chloroflexi bacterium]|nr:UbiD family decarboxylase [Chloroflexota bacterium]